MLVLFGENSDQLSSARTHHLIIHVVLRRQLHIITETNFFVFTTGLRLEQLLAKADYMSFLLTHFHAPLLPRLLC